MSLSDFIVYREFLFQGETLEMISGCLVFFINMKSLNLIRLFMNCIFHVLLRFAYFALLNVDTYIGKAMNGAIIRFRGRLERLRFDLWSIYRKRMICLVCWIRFAM
jgi:hypothetical protein